MPTRFEPPFAPLAQLCACAQVHGDATYALALSGGGTEARVGAGSVRSQEYAGKSGKFGAKVEPETIPGLAHKAAW